jgi:hypothetical protein
VISLLVCSAKARILRAFFMAALRGQTGWETRSQAPACVATGREERDGSGSGSAIRASQEALSEPILSGEKLKVGYKINDSLMINDELRHIHRHYLRIRGDKP